MGSWKLVAAGKDNPWELYDLAVDRAESRNLAAAHPERVSAMAALWTHQEEEHTALAKTSLSKP